MTIDAADEQASPFCRQSSGDAATDLRGPIEDRPQTPTNTGVPAPNPSPTGGRCGRSHPGFEVVSVAAYRVFGSTQKRGTGPTEFRCLFGIRAVQGGFTLSMVDAEAGAMRVIRIQARLGIDWTRPPTLATFGDTWARSSLYFQETVLQRTKLCRRSVVFSTVIDEKAITRKIQDDPRALRPQASGFRGWRAAGGRSPGLRYSSTRGAPPNINRSCHRR